MTLDNELLSNNVAFNFPSLWQVFIPDNKMRRKKNILFNKV